MKKIQINHLPNKVREFLMDIEETVDVSSILVVNDNEGAKRINQHEIVSFLFSSYWFIHEPDAICEWLKLCDEEVVYMSDLFTDGELDDNWSDRLIGIFGDKDSNKKWFLWDNFIMTSMNEGNDQTFLELLFSVPYFRYPFKTLIVKAVAAEIAAKAHNMFNKTNVIEKAGITFKFDIAE